MAPGGASGCFSSVQDAIDNSAEGTSIYVLQGSYAENIVISKTVLLLGGCDNTLCMPNTPGASTLDGSGSSAPVIRVINGANPIIDGFTITGGDGTSNDGRGGGIAVREAAATIRNNTIHHNVASSDVRQRGIGGGIDVITPTLSLHIEGNVIEYNIAYSPVLTSPHVAEYGRGGGISIHGGEVKMVNNQIRNNIAAQTDIPSDDASGFSGGLSLIASTTAELTGNTFQENLALDTGYWGFGGAMELDITDAITLTNNRLISNTAVISGYAGGGGGILVFNTEYPGARYTLLDNEIIGNVGMVQARTSPNFQGTLFVNGGGIYVAGDRAMGTIYDLRDNLIRANVAAKHVTITGDGVQGRAAGGGVHIREAGSVNIVDNEVARQCSRRTRSGREHQWMDRCAERRRHRHFQFRYRDREPECILRQHDHPAARYHRVQHQCVGRSSLSRRER